MSRTIKEMMVERHIFTPAEAMSACAAVIDEYEAGEVMSELRERFAKQMFAKLEPGDARIVVRYYPFCEIIAKSDWPNL